MINYFKLVRPLNCAITFITVIVAAIICSSHKIDLFIVLLGSLAAAFTAASGNIINDFYDVEIDRISHPNRPLVTGRMTKKSALYFYAFLNLAALIIAINLSLEVFAFVFIVIGILFYYASYLKKVMLVGNFTIAALTGITFIYGGMIVGNVQAAIIPAGFAFLINLIREILKDIQDVGGDEKVGIKTFPIKYGISRAVSLIIFLTIILIATTFYPFICELYKIEYFVFVMSIVNPVLIYFIKELYNNNSSQKLNKLSNLLKLNMIFGLIAIYLGQ